ncbi:MAG: hypothetical protein P8X96_09420 [Desulfobacteraceae bacterium]
MPMKIIATIIVILFMLAPASALAQAKSIKRLTIPTKSRLCPKDTHRGDREFKGHGPDVTATARLRIDARTRVTLFLTLHAIETRKDWTEARGDWTYQIYKAPIGFKVNRILSDAVSEAKYRDTNHKLDVPKVTKGNLVRRFEINGDTSGNDIGNCTTGDVYMNVRFNPVRIEIQELEKIITRFTNRSDYPRQSVNKLSQNIRAIASNGAHWYFTQSGSLWKIPVSFDLNSLGLLLPASAKAIDIPPFLERKGYRRFGDLDYYRGYIFAALEGDGRVKDRPLVAVFRATDLALEKTISMGRWLKSIGWIAINPVTGNLYTSQAALTPVAKRFKVKIAPEDVTLAPASNYALHQRNGGGLSLQNPQSGTFSADGRYLFVVDRQGPTSRLMSFNRRTGREMVSSLFISKGTGLMAVSYVNTGTKAPGVRGVLHVVMRQPDPQARHAFSLKHYSVVEGFDWNN